MNNQNIYKTNKYDFVLSGLILFFSFSFIFSFNNNGKNQEIKAFIYTDNKLIKEINLSKHLIVDIDKVRVEVEKGRIRVLKSNCPGGICKHSGWISSPAQTIICLPNKLLIEIVGKDKQLDYDAVSY